MPKEAKYILDSFAVLAYFQAEDGGERVRSILKEAGSRRAAVLLSAISLGEIYYITARKRDKATAQAVLEDLSLLPLDILAATTERVLAAAEVKASYPVSYADAFVVAAAEELSAMIVTGDPEFKKIEDRAFVLWF